MTQFRQLMSMDSPTGYISAAEVKEELNKLNIEKSLSYGCTSGITIGFLPPKICISFTPIVKNMLRLNKAY